MNKFQPFTNDAAKTKFKLTEPIFSGVGKFATRQPFFVRYAVDRSTLQPCDHVFEVIQGSRRNAVNVYLFDLFWLPPAATKDKIIIDCACTSNLLLFVEWLRSVSLTDFMDIVVSHKDVYENLLEKI